MAHVFMMCVGTRDPQWAMHEGRTVPFSQLTGREVDRRDGPILTFFKAFPPVAEGRVYLFSTQSDPQLVRDPTERGGEATRDELRRRFPKLVIEHRRFRRGINPAEFPEVLDALGELINVALTENPNSEFVVNVSPGTPQMQAAWYLLAHTGRLPARLYRIATDPATDQYEPVPINLTPFIVADFSRLASAAFERSDFHGAQRLFGELATKTSGGAARRIELCAALCEVYAQWVLGDYLAATDTLNNSLNRYRDIITKHDPVNNHFAQLHQALHQRADSRSQLRLADLYHIARLRFVQGAFIDTLWRACAIIERIEIDRARQFDSGVRDRISAHRILLDNRATHALPRVKDENDLFSRRNKALHQGSAVSAQDARRALELAEVALGSWHPDLRGQLNAHPLAEGPLGQAAQVINMLVA